MEEDGEQPEVTDEVVIEQVRVDVDEESDEEYVRNSVDSPDFYEGSVGVDLLDVPNGLLDADSPEDSEYEEEEDVPLEEDGEIPLQPRINLRQFMGHQQTVNDSSESEDDEREEDGERFDQQLPGQHSYLGPGRQVEITRSPKDPLADGAGGGQVPA